MSTGVSPRGLHRSRRLLSSALALLMTVTTLHAGTVPASAAERPAPAVPADRPAPKGTPLTPRSRTKPDAALAAAVTKPPAVTSVAAGSSDVAVGSTVRFGGLGVSLPTAAAAAAGRPSAAPRESAAR
jgi:hypothetical protein